MNEIQLKYGRNPNQKPSRIFMEDGSDLRSCGAGLWLKFIVRHTGDEFLCYRPLHGFCGPSAWLVGVA